jgi:hypothetical protein
LRTLLRGDIVNRILSEETPKCEHKVQTHDKMSTFAKHAGYTATQDKTVNVVVVFCFYAYYLFSLKNLSKSFSIKGKRIAYGSSERYADSPISDTLTLL